jgi:virginiamycin A acetyltransferase
MLQFLREKLTSFVQNTNYVKLKPGSNLHESVKLKGVRLNGRIRIGASARLSGVTINGRVDIGHYTVINGPNTVINAQINHISIGSYCSIAKDVTIQEYNHDFERISTYYMRSNIFKTARQGDHVTRGPVIIGNDVWIGTKAVILSGVTVHNGAVIAANAVVTRDVPAYHIVAGSPARVVRSRFQPSVIEQLEKLAWWDWPIEKIKLNKELFWEKLDVNTLKSIK